MLEQLGLFGLFLGCMLSATVVPFASEALLAGALLMGYGKWAVTFVAALGNTTGGDDQLFDGLAVQVGVA